MNSDRAERLAKLREAARVNWAAAWRDRPATVQIAGYTGPAACRSQVLPPIGEHFTPALPVEAP